MKPILFILFLATFISAQESWLWQNPWPQGNDLNDVAVIDENKMIAVGNNSVILTTNDGGDSWQIAYYDELNTELNSIFFIDDYTGWICGTSSSDYKFGIILRTDDGGNTWNRVDILPNVYLTDIQFFDENTGWASGINSIRKTPYLFKTENGGQSWIEDELSTKEAENCTFQFFDIDTGIVTFREGYYPKLNGEFLKTHDGGITWDSLAPGFDCNYFSSNQNGWAIRNYYGGWGSDLHRIYKTNDGGKSWQTDTTYFGSGHVNNIYLSDTLLTTSTGAFDFYDNGHGLWVGEYGSISKSEDGGRTWLDKSKIAATYNLNSIFFLSENVGWTVGGEEWNTCFCEPEHYEYGYVLKTNNGGATWNKISIVNHMQLYDVQFTDSENGWAIGMYDDSGYSDPQNCDNAYVLKTNDGGKQWEIVLGTKFVCINGLHFINENIGYVIGKENTFLKTLDGGDNWQNVFPSCLDSSITLWSFNSIYFLNRQDAWVSAEYEQGDQKENILLKTNNGGVTWDSLSYFYTFIITDMFFVNQDIGWFCGKRNEDYGLRGFIAKTENGGKSWWYTEYYYKTQSLSDELCALSSIEFIDENKGWALGDKTFYTEDGGESWYKAKENQLSGGGNDVFFINETNGWLVGNSGKILKTTTGGLTFIEEESLIKNIPRKLILNQNYPNPFNPTTTISYQLPVSSSVELNIYNLLGQKVANLVSERQPAGNHKVEWDASGFASGVYYYQLRTGAAFIQTKKLILLR